VGLQEAVGLQNFGLGCKIAEAAAGLCCAVPAAASTNDLHYYYKGPMPLWTAVQQGSETHPSPVSAAASAPLSVAALCSVCCAPNSVLCGLDQHCCGYTVTPTCTAQTRNPHICVMDPHNSNGQGQRLPGVVIHRDKCTWAGRQALGRCNRPYDAIKLNDSSTARPVHGSCKADGRQISFLSTPSNATQHADKGPKVPTRNPPTTT